MNKFQKKYRFIFATINFMLSTALFVIVATFQLDLTFQMKVSGSGIISWLVLVVALLFSGYILFSNREYGVKWAWLLFIFFLPLLGAFTFYIVGRSPREIWKLRKKKKVAEELSETWDDIVRPTYELGGDTRISDAAFISKHPIFTKTKVDILEANEPFMAIQRAVEAAEHHIHFEFYMIYDDEVTHPIFDILCEKAKKGVKVRVLADYVGTLMSFFQSRTIERLLAAGAEVEFYNKTFSMLFDSTVLYRNHRKVVIVDGKVGFTGGYNFEGKYGNKQERKPYWRDLHLQLEGDAVHQLQRIFLIDWYSTTGEIVIDKQVTPIYFPVCEEKSHGYIQIVPDGYDTIQTTINDAYFRLITQAKKSVDIATPYFVPTPELLTALKIAARTGVKVRILLPGVPDKKSVYAASRSFVSELLESGVQVYLMNDTFVHQKLIIIDNVNAAVGTSNFDLRSIHTNLELMVFMYAHQEVERLSELFTEDLRQSQLITIEMWNKRPIGSKVLERFFSLFSALF